MKEIPRVGDVHSWCHMVFLKLGVVQIVECSKCRFPGPASEPPFKRPGVGPRHFPANKQPPPCSPLGKF